MYSSKSQLLLNKPHNGHLAALFLEVELLRKEFECSSVINKETQMSLILPWEKVVAYRKRCKVEVKMLCGCGMFASSSALESGINYSQG